MIPAEHTKRLILANAVTWPLLLALFLYNSIYRVDIEQEGQTCTSDGHKVAFLVDISARLTTRINWSQKRELKQATQAAIGDSWFTAYDAESRLRPHEDFEKAGARARLFNGDITQFPAVKTLLDAWETQVENQVASNKLSVSDSPSPYCQ